MTDQITVEELEKASNNVRRLSEFIAQRRAWTVPPDAEEAASSLAAAARSLAGVVTTLAGADASDPPEIRQPPKLEPSGTVAPDKLVKFADFITDLRRWFESHDGSELPPRSEESITSIRGSLTGTIAAIDSMLGLAPVVESVTEPLITADLGPVVEVDMSARLELDNIASRPLLQVFRGVTELTPEATSKIDRFFATQGIELKGPERRRFHEKALKWLKGTPEGQMLVIRLSGLSGKVEAYSSYKPRDR
jgi:hypothetical protein